MGKLISPGDLVKLRRRDDGLWALNALRFFTDFESTFVMLVIAVVKAKDAAAPLAFNADEQWAIVYTSDNKLYTTLVESLKAV